MKCTPRNRAAYVLTVRQCDERLPGCARCEKYGKPCPGYDRGFKFIAGKPYRTPRQKPETGRDSLSEKQSKTERTNAGKDRRKAVVLKEQPWSLTYGDVNVMQSLAALIQEFSQPASSSQTHLVSQWFSFLPSVYGHSQVLDASIKSFAAHHFGKVFQNERMIAYARSAYGEALYRLRKSLNDPSECLSSHVFYSVVLLCMYEVRKVSSLCHCSNDAVFQILTYSSCLPIPRTLNPG